MNNYHFFIVAIIFLLPFQACSQQQDVENQAQQTHVDSLYTQSAPSSADGTGKYYMGRDIAQVMGHTGAAWLERSGREEEEGTDILLKALDLQKDDVVADIGAGTGYFSFRMSPKVPQGQVLAVDIQPEMLQMIHQKMEKEGVDNIKTILGNERQPKLPQDSVDWVLLVDAYHEFSYPREMMEYVVRSLKANGKVALVEYRAEDPEIMIKPRHKMTEKQAVKEMEAVGLQLRENKDVLPQQHLMIFEKKEGRTL